MNNTKSYQYPVQLTVRTLNNTRLGQPFTLKLNVQPLNRTFVNTLQRKYMPDAVTKSLLNGTPHFKTASKTCNLKIITF